MEGKKNMCGWLDKWTGGQVNRYMGGSERDEQKGEKEVSGWIGRYMVWYIGGWVGGEWGGREGSRKEGS